MCLISGTKRCNKNHIQCSHWNRQNWRKIQIPTMAVGNVVIFWCNRKTKYIFNEITRKKEKHFLLSVLCSGNKPCYMQIDIMLVYWPPQKTHLNEIKWKVSKQQKKNNKMLHQNYSSICFVRLLSRKHLKVCWKNTSHNRPTHNIHTHRSQFNDW